MTANNADECMFVQNEEQRDDCFNDVAFDTNNSLFCDFLFNAKRNGCILSVAKNTENVTTCNAISDALQQDACRFKIAKLTANPQLCYLISFNGVRDLCFEQLNATPQFKLIVEED